MKRVLAAIDFSDVTNAVLDAAAALVKLSGGSLCVLHTEPPDPDFVGYEVGPQSVRDSVAQGIKEDAHHLEAIRRRLIGAGVDPKCLLFHGPTVEKILEESGRFKADVIVIGSHEHGAFHHLLHGSVVDSLLTRAPCPVLVVPAGAK